MDNFVFSLNATIPIFLVMVLGYILMRVKFFTEDFVSVVNKYVFKVALPVLLFRHCIHILISFGQTVLSASILLQKSAFVKHFSKNAGRNL